MKELELTLRIRNNRLKERREQLSMSQPELAEAADISLTGYRELECMRLTPRTRGGRWRKIALELAAFHCVEPEELFPPAVESIEQPVAVRRVDGADLRALLSTHQERLLEGPDGAQERCELREKLQHALATLPPRDAEVLRLRYGLHDGEERTLDEVGEVFDIQRERVRQIQLRALRTLRHPSRANALQPFHDEHAESGS